MIKVPETTKHAMMLPLSHAKTTPPKVMAISPEMNMSVMSKRPTKSISRNRAINLTPGRGSFDGSKKRVMGDAAAPMIRLI